MGPYVLGSQRCPRAIAWPKLSCQNGKIAHIHLGLASCEWVPRSANVACEPICISNIPYTVPWPMRPECTGGLNIVHVGPKI